MVFHADIKHRQLNPSVQRRIPREKPHPHTRCLAQYGTTRLFQIQTAKIELSIIDYNYMSSRCLHLSVCVREKEKGREGDRDRYIDREKERERE